MPEAPNASPALMLHSASGMRAHFNANGSLRRFDCEAISLALFVGNELEGAASNLYLRCRTGGLSSVPLLGPQSPTRFRAIAPGQLIGCGSWRGIDYSVALVLAQSTPAWFWHVQLYNAGAAALELDLTLAQDLALAPYGAVRMNEFYVSQYIDHTPLRHAARGWVLASRQNQAADGRNPWSLLGSLRCARSFGTDALQFWALAARANQQPPAQSSDLPATRLQHEHSMLLIRDEPLALAPGQGASAGFFGGYVPDHPAASAAADLQRVEQICALPEAVAPPLAREAPSSVTGAATLFSDAPPLEALDLDAAALRELFAPAWRHEELGAQGEYLSFFHGADRHVVLRAKELQVLRPHGHILRSGRHLTPDETAVTSTVWMNGVFHSMLTQGHVSINRILSTVRSYLGLFRAHGLRVFVQLGERWRLLQLPSAFEIAPQSCRWIYRHAAGEIHVLSQAGESPNEQTLSIEVRAGEPTRCLLSLHVALNDDDGSALGPALWQRDGADILVKPAPASELGRRFPAGRFRISPIDASSGGAPSFEAISGDEALFVDGRSRAEPYLCIRTAPVRSIGLRLRAELIEVAQPAPLFIERSLETAAPLVMRLPPGSALAERVAQTAEIVPWLTHNAWVHYLAPRGLEQYSGGGWGTRDVCQGPVELLLALDRTAPLRDLLLRVLAMQNPDGDWPQWFMFFERERAIRAGDSHGDIVFWPLLVLAQYLLASGDAALLQESVGFFDAGGAQAGERASVWQHAQRALALVGRRVIAGTALAAYGHGDWNDALQPADPRLRDRLCSAWTVTLHFQTLTTLARALRSIAMPAEAEPLEHAARAVQRDFQRLLLVDEVLAGYALFETDGQVRHLLHPRDATTGVRYSALAMVHAILEDLLSPEQARAHLRLIDEHLSGPDGLRLFDRPLDYHGGPQRLFQRAESATFFGREIGLMYMHAHLRFAQALAHMGEAERFFQALCQANPIGIRSLVPSATLRQANCYYSSSDAAFADRYQASAEYQRVGQGAIALDGGWRVYSSGAGIALGLIVRQFLGLDFQANALRIDPVMPPALDGLRVRRLLRGAETEIHYRIGTRGSDVQRLTLNGQPLQFVREANAHRQGAVRVALSELSAGLAVAGNLLVVELA